MTTRTRKNLFVAGGLAVLVIGTAILAGIIYLIIVTLQTILAD
jgi:hypothetical protein